MSPKQPPNSNMLDLTDPVERTQALARIADTSSRLLARTLTGKHNGSPFSMADPAGIGNAFAKLTVGLMSNPTKLIEAQVALCRDYAELWQGTAFRMFGITTEPTANPERSDRRFRDDAWDENFIFDFIKQFYLITARWLETLVEHADGLDEQTTKKVEFYTRQFVDTFAPSNFALTNPQVLRATMESGGKNLLEGLNNLLEDLEKGEGQLRIKMTDMDAFVMGKNIALTPGKVVFQNELMQLLQYNPTTEQVYRRPLLIVPPWINKYYILDLRPQNSFIRWAVNQGHTVFVISWFNPDERLSHKGFDNYLVEGPIAALDAIEQATGEPQANAIGYCLGGTLLGCTLGYLTAKGEPRIASATHFTTLLDFSDPGELGIFIDEQQLSALEKSMEEKGYLDGRTMATTFNLLRANDLIWSFYINNYLLGREPFPFDLLYWNSDSTRMPANMHRFYLRNMYQNNLLQEPGGITLDGVAIDLGKVTTPAYFLSTREDHIAPWTSTYVGSRLYSGPVRFVLSGSGHIAGVINPPVAEKYGYWINNRRVKNHETWFKGAKQHEGSWWQDWAKWVAQYAEEKIPARVPGDGKLAVIEDAPGSYVSNKIDS